MPDDYVHCTTCGKRAYFTRKAAKRAARRIHPDQQLNAYRCGPYWHYGHLPNAVRFGVLPRGAQSGRPA